MDSRMPEMSQADGDALALIRSLERQLQQEKDYSQSLLLTIKGCGFEIYIHDDGRVGLRNDKMIYLPAKDGEE